MRAINGVCIRARRRTSALAVAASLVIGGMPAWAGDAPTACPAGEVPASGFTDTSGNTHEAHIECVAWYGIAKGVGGAAYAPERAVRRDQMASFIARLVDLAIELPWPSDQGFTDVSGNAHEDRINQLAELDVVRGTTTTTYSPERDVRRDQMASFLVRAWKAATGETLRASSSRHFVDTAGNTHEEAIDIAFERGWAKGISTGRYSPELPVRRDQMASFISRMLDDLVAEGHAPSNVVGDAPDLLGSSLTGGSDGLTSGDALSLVFAEVVVANSAVTLADADGDRTTLDDEATAGVVDGRTASQVSGSGTKQLTFTLSENPDVTGSGDGTLDLPVTIVAASGITSESGVAWDPATEGAGDVSVGSSTDGGTGDGGGSGGGGGGGGGSTTPPTDTTAPDAPTVSSVTNPVTASNVGAVAIDGSTEPNAAVKVIFSDGTTQVAASDTADNTGAWSISDISLASLKDGSIGVAATARDAAGNTSLATDKTITKDVVGPALAAVRLVTEADPVAADATPAWSDVGDVLRLEWSESAFHARGDGSLTVDEVNALLGTSVMYADASTVTLVGDGASEWTLTIGGAALNTGLAAGEAAPGSRNADIADSVGNEQTAAAGVILGDGPRPARVALVDDESSDGAFANDGDVMQVMWTEPAHSDVSVLTLPQLNALLGTNLTASSGEPTVSVMGTATDTWRLTLSGTLAAGGLADGAAVPGSNNADVLDGDDNPQLRVSGVKLTAAPYIVAVGALAGGTDGAFDLVGDQLRIDWSEPVSFVPGGSSMSLVQLQDVLGVTIMGSTTTFTLDDSDPVAWVIEVTTEALSPGIAVDTPTNGTVGNADIVDGDGLTQALASGVVFETGPRIADVVMVSDDGDATWQQSGDVLQIRWDQVADRLAGDGDMSESALEAVLGTAVALSTDDVLATPGSVSVAGTGTDLWTVTIDAALVEGIADGDPLPGTENEAVVDDPGFPQVAGSSAALEVGPSIETAQLTADTGAIDTWDAIGDQLSLAWTEAPAWPAVDSALGHGDVAAILGTALAFEVGTTVQLTGAGTEAWVLTVGGAALAEGVDVGDAVPGSSESDVTDAGGAPQVPADAVLVDRAGPFLTNVVLTDDSGEQSWREVGDELTLTWSERAKTAATSLDQTAVRALLGNDTIVFGTTSTVAVSGSDTSTWTLTIGGQALAPGIADGASVPGRTTGSPAKDLDDNLQVPNAAGVSLVSGPRITATVLTFDDGGGTDWKAVGDELTVYWSEPAAHAGGDGELTEDQVNAILGPTTAVAYGAGGTPLIADDSTVTLEGSGTDTWTLTIGALALATGVNEPDGTPGTANDAVTDAVGNPQLPNDAAVLRVGPVLTAVALTVDSGASDVFDAVGDVLTLTWPAAAEHAVAGSELTATHVADILGAAVTYGTGRIDLGGDGTSKWTLTVVGGDLASGVDVGDSAPGTNNPDVTATTGAPQVPATRETVSDEAPLRIVRTVLVGDDGDKKWNADGDELAIEWSDTADYVGGNFDAEIETILGVAEWTPVSGSPTAGLSQDGTGRWIVTLASGAIDGIRVGEATNGSSNVLVDDTDGNTQLVSTGVMLDSGPVITATTMTGDDGDGVWQQVHDELTIVWSEPVHHASGDGKLTQAQVNNVLGTAITFAGADTADPITLDDSTVTLSGSGSDAWTLTIGQADLSTGIAENATTDGSNNGHVTAVGDGDPQTTTSGVMLSRGPHVVASGLSQNHDPDDDATLTGPAPAWDAVGDVLRLEWSEVVTHASADGELTEAQVEDLLGVTIAYGMATTVTLVGSGSALWTLTIGGAALTDGVSDGDATPGTNNGDVTDGDGHHQIENTVELDSGPRIAAATLNIDGDVNNRWDAAGDVLTLTFTEDATHADLDNTLTTAQLQSLLGTGVDVGTSGAVVTVAGSGTTVWTLTISGGAISDPVVVGDDVKGTNNAGVTSKATGLPQIPTTGVTLQAS